MIFLYLFVFVILVAFVWAGIRQALEHNKNSELDGKDKWFVIDNDVWATTVITTWLGSVISAGICLLLSVGTNFFFKKYETAYFRDLQRVESTYVVAEGDYYRFYTKVEDESSVPFIISKNNIRIVIDDNPRVEKETIVRPAIVDHLFFDMTKPRYVLYIPEGSIHRIFEE